MTTKYAPESKIDSDTGILPTKFVTNNQTAALIEMLDHHGLKELDQISGGMAHQCCCHVC
ncbi:MAG: hypothetical protein ABI865_15135 [Nitrosospira sp.]